MTNPRLTPARTAALFAILLAPALFGQEPRQPLAAEFEVLAAGQREILRQLEEIRRLLVPREAPAGPEAASGVEVAGRVFDVGANPVRGATGARLTLVEFTDYQ